MHPSRNAGAATLAVAVLAGMLAGLPLRAQQPDPLQDVQSAITAEENRLQSLASQAGELAAEINRLQGELVAAAEAVQEREDELTKLEQMLAALEGSEAAKTRALADRQSDMGLLMAALQRLSIQPREALILGWQSPMDTVLSTQLLSFAMPPLRSKAQRLRAELADIAELRNQAQRERIEIATATESLKTARESIKRLVDFKAGLRQTTEAERLAATERVKALAAQAGDLRELLAALPAQPEPPVATPGEEPPIPAAAIRLERPKDLKSFPPKRQGVVPPARGDIAVNFGDPGEDGIDSQGIVIETRAEAQVVAPHDGQIVFRGPFRGYGEILIIEHRGGYHTLLAGLGRTDAVVGQWLLAGEPVGIMDSPREHKPRLYVELRRSGRPINPWPWLEARISKVE